MACTGSFNPELNKHEKRFSVRLPNDLRATMSPSFVHAQPGIVIFMYSGGVGTAYGVEEDYWRIISYVTGQGLHSGDHVRVGNLDRVSGALMSNRSTIRVHTRRRDTLYLTGMLTSPLGKEIMPVPASLNGIQDIIYKTLPRFVPLINRPAKVGIQDAQEAFLTCQALKECVEQYVTQEPWAPE